MMKARLKEPSTWAGLAGILAAVATMPLPEGPKAWIAGAAGVCGAVAMYLREAANADADKQG